MNHATFLGRLGRNPDERTLGDGKRVTNFSLAVNRGKDKDPLWVNCTAWDKTAEIAARYLVKGDQALVEGSIEERTYTDKQGVERRAWSLIVSRLHLLGGGREERRSEPTDHDLAARNGQLKATLNNPRSAAPAFDDEVPF